MAINDENTTINEPATPVVEEQVIDDTAVTIQNETVDKTVEVNDESAEPATKATETTNSQETPDRKTQNTIQHFPHSHPCEWNSSADAVTLPSNHDKETRKILEKAPNVNLVDDPDARKWATTINDGLEMTTFAEAFVPTLEGNDAEFKQMVDVGGAALLGQSPKFKAAEDQNLKGERGILRLVSHLGLGSLFQTPLWHTGIWVTFKPPTEAEIVELNRLLVSEKIKFGRYTYGLIFSNMTAYTIDRLTEFAVDHIYDTTAMTSEVPIASLRDIISAQDIPSLLWGLICTMYPNGFQYRRACVSNPEKCNHVLEEMLNVSKLLWVNSEALTDWQKTHMSVRKSKTKDKASILRYKEELNCTQNKRIEFNKDSDQSIFMTIRTPSISEYINAGHQWIGDIVQIVERALGSDSSTGDREKHIKRHGQATAMRHFVHWVQSIEYGTNIIDDHETINGAFDVISADDTVRTEFIEAVIKFINDSTIAVIGIPVFDCPACGETAETALTLPQYKNIIPLDVVQLFFSLLTLRLGRVTER